MTNCSHCDSLNLYRMNYENYSPECKCYVQYHIFMLEVYKTSVLFGHGAVQYIVQYKIIKYLYCTNCNLIVI